MNNIELINIAHEARIGPITVGQNLSEIAENLGAPLYWNFLSGKSLDGILYYGALEIFVRNREQNVYSYLVQLRIQKIGIRKIKISNAEKSDKILVSRPSLKDLKYSKIKSQLTSLDISFSERTDAEKSTGMHEYMQFRDKVRFYFLKYGDGESILSYVELSDYRAPLA